MPHPARLPYLCPLDGLRGVAVAAVVLFHGGVSWAHGGFLGVDVFFVLSGFLITGLLLAESDATGRVDLKAFWLRRARRLLPALLAVLTAVVLAAPLLMADRTRLRGDALAALGYVANWRMMSGGDYFQQGIPSPLEHTWSLGIEEQFYLGWPLIVVLTLVAYGSARRNLARLAIIGATSSAVLLALRFTHDGGTRAYYGTDTRVQALLVGALLAIVAAHRAGSPEPLADRRLRWAVGGLSVAGVAVLGVMVVRASGTDPAMYRGGFTLAAVAAAAVIAGAVLTPSSPLAIALSASPLVALGRVSYGVYLWHWPLFLALTHARTHLLGWRLFVVRVLVTLVVAFVSYVAIERPVRRMKVSARGRWIAVPATGTAVASVALVAVFVPNAAGGSAGVRALVGDQEGSSSIAASHDAPADVVPTQPGDLPPAAPTAPAAPTPAASQAAVADVDPHSVLVVGDSVGRSLAHGLMPFAKENGWRLVDDAQLGCGMENGVPYKYFGQVRDPLEICPHWAAEWAADVAQQHPAVVVIEVGRWDIMDHLINGHWMRLGQPTYDARLMSDLQRAVDAVGAGGRPVVLATAPYFMRGESYDGGIWPEDEEWRVNSWNMMLRAVAATHPGQVKVADITSQLFPDGQWHQSRNGYLIQEDGVHLTAEGVAMAAPGIVPLLQSYAGGTAPVTGHP